MPLATTSLTRRVLLAASLALLAGCTSVRSDAPGPSAVPAARAEQDALLKAAERRFVDDCLAERGLRATAAPRAPAEDRALQAALFGTGPRELSVTLATGATVTAHSDGCLAAARDRLYGDQHRWFRVQVVVDNLRAEAQARYRDDPAHRAALARWTACVAPPGRPRPERPDPEEAARCSRETGLDETRARLERAELAEVRALHRDELATYRQLRDRALLRAVRLPAPTPPEKGNTPS
ncbi:hypothetical protein [Streptomyces sp. CC208A]|uniref:hypothetical protein n=1 Tax=Streptomyces sp. CC208A TaxID=3044573 RepID=UPI0024A8EA14|nr:hypothetical protein [Streptomyces sp. CC208A]